MSGALATSVDWNDDLNDESSELYTSSAASAKADLESLLTSSDDVQSATVTITGFEEASSNRKRRQANTSKATVNYSAECTVPESKSTDDISSSVETAVQNADPDNFSSFDSSSFASFSVDVEETTEATTQDATTFGSNADTSVVKQQLNKLQLEKLQLDKQQLDKLQLDKLQLIQLPDKLMLLLNL